MKITKRLAILSVFILVLPQSVQAMKQKRKMAAEKSIQNTFKLYEQGGLTFEQLQKRVDPLIRKYPEFAKTYDPKKLGQQQQEEEGLAKEEQERKDPYCSAIHCWEASTVPESVVRGYVQDHHSSVLPYD